MGFVLGTIFASRQSLIFTKINQPIKSNLSLNRSTSPWSTQTKILKNHIRVLKQPWSRLANLSFQGLYSESLNTVTVTSVYNKVDTQSSSNDHSNLDLEINHSKNPAVVRLSDLNEKYLDSKYFICGIFIDLQKAFDAVF